MLSIHQFKCLSQQQKLFAIDRAGTDLSLALFRKNESSLLFSFESFYVEVIFVKASRRIKKVRCFSTMKKLTRYLKQINIDDLTNLLSCSRK